MNENGHNGQNGHSRPAGVPMHPSGLALQTLWKRAIRRAAMKTPERLLNIADALMTKAEAGDLLAIKMTNELIRPPSTAGVPKAPPSQYVSAMDAMQRQSERLRRDERLFGAPPKPVDFDE